MRTQFDIDEKDDYAAVRHLLTRRCATWARRRDLLADEGLIGAMLDYRHFSVDGRLTFWTPAIVSGFVLGWVPRFFDHSPATPLGRIGEIVRTWLRYIAAEGLRDPRGATLAENEAAVDAAMVDLPAAMDDPERFGPAKIWMRIADAHGYQSRDADSMFRFQEDVRTRHVSISEEEAGWLLHADFRFRPLGSERELPQLPVMLPGPDDLARAASESVLLQRMITLTEWLAAPGRVVDADGNLGAKDTAEAMTELDIEWSGPPPSSSWDVPELRILLVLVYEERLVRRYRGRFVKINAQARRLSEPLPLWGQAFFQLMAQWHVMAGSDRHSRERHELGYVIRTIMDSMCESLYSLPEATPLPRLIESLCDAVLEYKRRYSFDDPPPDFTDEDRRTVEEALAIVLDTFEHLGVIERTVDVPHPMFVEDLVPDDNDELPDSPFDAETSARIAEQIVGGCELVRLTDLATAALRESMVMNGREAGLVGELTDASAAEMLGVVFQHYTPATAAAEIEAWLVANDADLTAIVDAARSSTLRNRAAAILELLSAIDPASERLLRTLRSDPVLGPAALACLVERRTLDLLDLTEPERRLFSAESALRLVETDLMTMMEGLRSLGEVDARAFVERVLTSGHPDTIGIDEFRSLVAEPLNAAAARREPPPKVDPTRLGSTRRARAHRRRDVS